MQVESLSYFLALSQTRSISAAARQLGISSSTLSRKIRQIEQELGVELFIREHRPLSLSRAGEHFLEHVPRLLQSLYQIEQLPQLSPKTTLQVGWHGAWGIYGLPGLIRAWQQGLGRDYRLESHSFPPEEALKLFSLGLLDFWIGSWAVNQTECLNRQAFKALGLQLYTGQASDCLIAGQPRPQTHWQELEYIALTPFTFAHSLWNEQLFPRHVAVCLSSVSDALALAQHSLLALYLPEIFLAEALARQVLAIIAEAPAHHSLTAGIVLNPHSLGSWLPALEQIVAEAGFRLYAI